MSSLQALSAALVWMTIYAGSIQLAASSSSVRAAATARARAERSERIQRGDNRRVETEDSSIPVRRPRIHGGWNTVEDRYSYAQVSLQWESEGHQCGGSLVAPDMVLTAAHCVGSFNKIEIGKYRKFDDTDVSEWFESIMEIKHPGYDEITTRYDVMLLKLNGATTLATPVRINGDESIPTDGDMLTVIGMGYNADWELPDAVQETSVEYNINDECAEIVDEHGITLNGDLYDDMLCAGSDGRDSCYGDSGSPLVRKGATMADDVQVGLVSWGYECAGTLPGVYSRLSHWPVYAFIEQSVCLHSHKPPDHFHCVRWTQAPTISPSDIPTWSPTELPSAAPSESLEPSHSLQPTISSAPVVPTEPPTSERLRQFLEGAADLPIQSRSTDEVQRSAAFDVRPLVYVGLAATVVAFGAHYVGFI